MSKNLTNYDLFLLKKMEEAESAKVSEENPAYADYLIRELRRTTPSESKVMTEEEFNRSENVARPVRAAAKSVNKGANFKKLGLVFLILYVIIVLALALIVMVHAGKSNVIPGADASAIEEGTIQTMPLEEKEQTSGNWFDEICDALNK